MKIKNIKLTDYFKLIKPEYVYLQITPHKSIRNYNSSNIAKAIAHTYKAINKRIYKHNKKLCVETPFKISYMIDITGNNSTFYFIIPKVLENIIIEKCREIWNKATLEIVEPPPTMEEDTEMYSLSYKKEDALSLAVDKKSNEPLNSLLSVMDIMKDEDRIRIVYNFLPGTQLGWLERYTNTIEKIKDHKSIEKKQMTFEYITRNAVLTVMNLFGGLIEIVNDFTGGTEEGGNKSLYNAILGVLEQQQRLSPNTNKKKEATILNTQIAILSQSKDDTRRANNSLSVCQAYRTLDEDNELIAKKVNIETKVKTKEVKPKKETESKENKAINKVIDIKDKVKTKLNINDKPKKEVIPKEIKPKFHLENFDFGTDINIFSTDEVSNFLELPGRFLLLQHKINHINVEENNIPTELQTGTKRLGVANYKGNKIPAFLENEYNNANLPLTLIGSQGGGKTTFIGNYSKDCIEAKEGIIVLDFIKNCELSETIKKYVPKEKLIELDLSSKEGIQGLGYNEIEIKEEGMDTFTKLKLASLQSQQLMSLVDAIGVGDPLSSRMRRYLNASSQVVFVQGANSVKNVIECLEDFNKRNNYIENLDTLLKIELEDEINTLRELDEWSKGSKKEGIDPAIIGSNTAKIEGVLDRIGMLREDYKLKYMYNKPLKDNINLINCMEEGKVVLIKMKEGDFPTKMQKNLLVTYFVSKIWLASQLRGMKSDKPLRCNVIIDEVFQAPTTMETLEYILPQSRKFACKFVFSTQYISQLDKIFDTLEASGSSFMLLTGSTENDFNHFKSKLDNFEFEDLKEMQQFSSLNLIKYSKGYSSFVTKLPAPV